MRKITSILLLFLMISGAAFAQQPQTSPEPVGENWAEGTKWYYIHFVKHDDYHEAAYLGTDGAGFVNSDGRLLLMNETFPKGNENAMWCVVGNDTDGYKFYNKGKGTGYILGFTSNTVAKMVEASTTTDTRFAYTQSGAYGQYGNPYATYKVQGSANRYWNNGDGGGSNDDYLCIWNDGKALSADGSAIDFVDVSEEVTALAKGSAPVATTISDGKFADNTQWYRLTIRNTKKVVTDVVTGKNSNDAANFNATYNALFAFVGSKESGYQIYNYAIGPNKGLSGVGKNNEVLTWSETPSTFYLKENTASGFQFQLGSEGTKYINDVDSQLGIWDYSDAATDEGSTFIIEAVSGLDNVVAKWPAVATVAYNTMATEVTAIANCPVGTDPGYCPDEESVTYNQTMKTTLDSYSEVEQRTVAGMRTLIDAYHTWKGGLDSHFNWPQAGKYYRVVSGLTFTSGDMAVDRNDDGKMGWRALNANSATQIWTIKPVSGGFAMQSLKDDMYPGKDVAHNTQYPMSVDATVLTLTSLGSGQFNLKTNGSATPFHAGGHSNGTGISGNIVAWSGNAGSASSWYIKEVTDLTDQQIAKIQLTEFNADNKDDFPTVTAGATVVWPNEFDGFTSVTDKAQLFSNAQALLADESATATQMFASVADIRTYRNNVRANGNLATLVYTFGAEYGTMLSPVPANIPTGVEVFTCEDVNAQSKLVLTSATSIAANIPYILKGTKGETFQLFGWNNQPEDNADQTNGILTGVYVAKEAPENSYVLMDQDGVLAFYKVQAGQQPTVGANRCYITPASNPAPAFYFGDDSQTGIEGIAIDVKASQVFDLSGRRVKSAKKGLYIVNGKKIMVK